MSHEIKFKFEGLAAERLDKVLAAFLSNMAELSGYSRSQIQRWIDSGKVSVNGKRVNKPGTSVAPGADVLVIIPEPEQTEILPSGREIEILYQDDDLLVINKPAAISMHPGAGRISDTIVHAVIGHISEQERQLGVRPGIVHRLDMDTTGLVVIAKTVQSHAALSRQFAGRTTGREYLALVYTTPRGRREVSTSDSGRIDTQFGRDPKRRLQMAVVASGGKRAITNWRVLERMHYGALIAVSLETGRTHQIRVHMNHIGAPIIGDPVYGDTTGLPSQLRTLATRFGRQALHARMLEFTHPRTSERMRFEKEPPEDFTNLVAAFREFSSV